MVTAIQVALSGFGLHGTLVVSQMCEVESKCPQRSLAPEMAVSRNKVHKDGLVRYQLWSWDVL